MPSPIWRHSLPARCATWILTVLLVSLWASAAHGMTDDQLRDLRRETTDLFYHGFDNYMAHAFPEDELKPLTCGPLTRDRENPAHIEVNDVLGNYSLTLIDSLSTLAILASSPEPLPNNRDPWDDFQRGIESLVGLYGDGSNGPFGSGKRSKGFDVDSKVQVFETVIRGVGGLLSAHLFAIGNLPVHARATDVDSFSRSESRSRRIPSWSRGLRYDGQLLRLAVDLANRLVPAFYTSTGLPYPRVNLRHGVPFYLNSPLNADSEAGICEKEPSGPLEITETCSAGAGSLVLEFTTLSRLTGDPQYEDLAKRAFWAVWDRRSDLDLLGAGVDAETGEWVSSYAGIGAGVDSFFEYALKSHILLSSSTDSSTTYNTPYNTTDSFLSVWTDAHASIKRHLYRGSSYQHPHYIQGDLFTGASKAYWVDSLSAFYPGLLALGGEVDEAIETHLLYTALWTRYAALPERWSTATSAIDAGLRWWGGRPEFIESTWYIYRATQDPFYLHVGEMAIKDIKRRCWTSCGWAGLEDVRTGELKDRMESFFLGETAKYLYLLFDTEHPLNKLDAPFVFTTEGHPLLLPKPGGIRKEFKDFSTKATSPDDTYEESHTATCQIAPSQLPFSISVVASRPDLFHAAGLARLHQVGNGTQLNGPVLPTVESSYDEVSYADVVLRSPTNYTFYPWTLPVEYIPSNGTSDRMHFAETFDLMFPTIPNTPLNQLFVNRVEEGVVINAVSGIKLGMIREMGYVDNIGIMEVFRIHSVGQLKLGRDEKVFISLETIANLNPADQYFTRHKELGMLDLVLDLPDTSTPDTPEEIHIDQPTETPPENTEPTLSPPPPASTPRTPPDQPEPETQQSNGGLLDLLLSQLNSAFDPSSSTSDSGSTSTGPLASLLDQARQHLLSLTPQTPATPNTLTQNLRSTIPAAIATGLGAAPVPSVPDAPYTPGAANEDVGAFFGSIYVLDGTLCDAPLPLSVVQRHQFLVLRRGDCSFGEKMRNIPSFAPSPAGLQLVVVVSFPDHEGPRRDGGGDAEGGGPGGDESNLVRPLLDEPQLTPSGMKRIHGIPMVLVDGGAGTWEALLKCSSRGGGQSRGQGGRQDGRIGIRRRYWYESQGIRIGNLFVI